MVKVKSIADAKANYEASAALVPTRYEQGVRGADWQGPAVAGQGLYVTQMSDPAVLARRRSGIERVSNSSWENDTITKGKGIIAGRMTAASGKWATNWAPFGAVIEAITLPPRVADGLQNLINRAGPIVQALQAKKAEMLR